MIALQFKMSGAGFAQHGSGYEIKSRVITQSRLLVNITLTLLNWKFTDVAISLFMALCIAEIDTQVQYKLNKTYTI